MTDSKKPGNVVKLFQGPQMDPGIEDKPLGRQLRRVPTLGVPAKPALDLTGKPKVVMVMGDSNTGKTFLLRYIAEQALAADPHCTAIFGKIDADKPGLFDYFSADEVTQPDNYHPSYVLRWVEALISDCMQNKRSAAVDFGGRDSSIVSLVQQQDDLPKLMEAANVHPVAVYMLGPRVEDLALLATLEQSGFQPAATALILNGGLGDPYLDFNAAFARIKRHPDFCRAVERGAQVVHLPRLHAAAAVELRRVGFLQARDAIAPVGRSVPPLDAFDRGRVGRWLLEMQAALGPIRSWFAF
jgi:hypothetical protein